MGAELCVVMADGMMEAGRRFVCHAVAGTRSEKLDNGLRVRDQRRVLPTAAELGARRSIGLVCCSDDGSYRGADPGRVGRRRHFEEHGPSACRGHRR